MYTHDITISRYTARRVGRLKRALALATLVCVIPFLTGCNAYATATRTQAIVAGILSIANADIPVLEQAGTITPADAPIVNAYLALGVSLNTQLGSCIAGANSAGGKSAAFLSCFTTFSNGLLSPSELAGLRVLSPKAQTQTVLWVTAIALGVNVAFQAFGGATVATPVQIGSAPPPTTADIRVLRWRVEQAMAYAPVTSTTSAGRVTR
jgi:hypothetical protein